MQTSLAALAKTCARGRAHKPRLQLPVRSQPSTSSKPPSRQKIRLCEIGYRGTGSAYDLSGHTRWVAYRKLQMQLHELNVFLVGVGEKRWAVWSDHVAAQLAEGSVGPDEVRRAFGGMGSLSDLVIHPANGHRVGAEEVDQVNRRLDRHRSRIFAASQVARLERLTRRLRNVLGAEY